MFKPMLLSAVLLTATATWAEDKADKYVGYYYPEVTSTEKFDRVIRTDIPQANRAVRVDLVTQLTKAQLAAPDTPRFAVFAKGGEAEHMIAIALDDQVFKTLYRARAVLAQRTSDVRAGTFLKQQGLQFEATFYDMLQMFGYKTLVISDGETWTHKVTFIRE